MSNRVLVGGMKFRPYQKPVVRYFDQGGKRASLIWHRRSGKDRTMLNVICRQAMKRVGLYWHALPTHKQARKVVWDNLTKDGVRLMDATFPAGMRHSTNETEMKITLKNGSVVQLVGADNFDSLIGANPVGIVFSEYAVTHPRAWDLMRPIIVENDGWAAFVTTPRGYNGAFKVHEAMKANPDCYTSLLTIKDTGVMSDEQVQEEIRQGMPEELARQEFYCDFSAANVGAILGRYVEEADKSGRLTLDPVWDMDGAPIVVTSDIGFRDTAAWWFWQVQPGGFALVDYDEDNGMDAEEWIERLRQKPWKLDKIYLPHDARAKTFQSRHSVVEQFLSSGIAPVKIAPAMKTQDKINAARSVLPRCRFDAAACAQGIIALREWSFKYDEERKTFSKEPDHNFASHGADAFCYGAAMLRDYVPERVRVEPDPVAMKNFNLQKLFADHERFTPNRRIG